LKGEVILFRIIARGVCSDKSAAVAKVFRANTGASATAPQTKFLTHSQIFQIVD
jgi:hypothetical protein